MASPSKTPLTNKRRYWILISIGAGTFMTALDASVVNVVLPLIREYFNARIATIEWVVVVYLLTLSAMLLTFGRLGDLRGHKSVYLTGFALFILSSALCGMSGSASTLVLWRVLQALGGAMLMSNSPAILTKSFPPEKRGQALGLQATMTYLGLVTGPALGGLLAQQFSWRAVFYINIPVGLIAFLLSLYFIPNDHGSMEKEERFDLLGALIFSSGLVSLLLGLNKGHAWGWTSLPILGLLALAAVLLGLFIIIEKRVPNPMLDLQLFRERNFSAATASAVFNYISLYSMVFLLPFYLIQGRGLNSAEAGLLLTAQPLVMVVTAPLSGILSDRIGTRMPAILGLLIAGCGAFLLSTIHADSALRMIAFYLAFYGLGIGIFISPNTSALMGAAPRHRQGIAAGVMATSRTLGMVLGVGMAGAILTTIMGHSSDGLFRAVSVGFLAAMGASLLGSLTAVLRRDKIRE
jgi:EmrB/QacA subfamily drug resistance transporter